MTLSRNYLEMAPIERHQPNAILMPPPNCDRKAIGRKLPSVVLSYARTGAWLKGNPEQFSSFATRWVEGDKCQLVRARCRLS
jgi:hypothetical protein